MYRLHRRTAAAKVAWDDWSNLNLSHRFWREADPCAESAVLTRTTSFFVLAFDSVAVYFQADSDNGSGFLIPRGVVPWQPKKVNIHEPAH
jgi:hypothetical protein